MVPLSVGAEGPGLGEGFGALDRPGGARYFETGLQDVFMSALDQARADGQFAGLGLVVGEGMAAVFEIAVSAEKNKKNKGQQKYS